MHRQIQGSVYSVNSQTDCCLHLSLLELSELSAVIEETLPWCFLLLRLEDISGRSFKPSLYPFLPPCSHCLYLCKGMKLIKTKFWDFSLCDVFDPSPPLWCFVFTKQCKTWSCCLHQPKLKIPEMVLSHIRYKLSRKICIFLLSPFFR